MYEPDRALAGPLLPVMLVLLIVSAYSVYNQQQGAI